MQRELIELFSVGVDRPKGDFRCKDFCLLPVWRCVWHRASLLLRVPRRVQARRPKAPEERLPRRRVNCSHKVGRDRSRQNRAARQPKVRKDKVHLECKPRPMDRQRLSWSPKSSRFRIRRVFTRNLGELSRDRWRASLWPFADVHLGAVDVCFRGYCEPRHRGRRSIYEWTEHRVRGRRAE